MSSVTTVHLEIVALHCSPHSRGILRLLLSLLCVLPLPFFGEKGWIWWPDRFIRFESNTHFQSAQQPNVLSMNWKKNNFYKSFILMLRRCYNPNLFIKNPFVSRALRSLQLHSTHYDGFSSLLLPGLARFSAPKFSLHSCQETDREMITMLEVRPLRSRRLALLLCNTQPF